MYLLYVRDNWCEFIIQYGSIDVNDVIVGSAS